MSDYISRADVTSYLKGWQRIIRKAYGKQDDYYKCLDEVIGKIEDDVPTADVQKVRCGRWIKKHDDVCYWHECSECGFPPLKYRVSHDYCLSAYCPNCGARMEAEEDVHDN